MKIGLPAYLYSRFPYLLLLWLLALAVSPALASQGNDEVTPEVQELYAQARAARQRGDNPTAIAKYQAMIKLAPHLAAAYNNLGMLYFDSHDYARAAGASAWHGAQPQHAKCRGHAGDELFPAGKE